MTSKFLNLSTDTTLGGSSASDETVSSQKAIKAYVDNHSGGTITVDDAISLTSENPVQNKVITAAISDLYSQVNIDTYLDLIIAGNTQDLPITMHGTYETELTDIIGGTYVNV